MASVTSLGIHKPSAIPFLVSEGILPTEPSENLYEWRTVPDHSAPNEHERQEEELLITEYCVVCSRNAVVQRVFRFDVEGEAVTQAVFTHFLANAERVSAPEAKCGRAPCSERVDDLQALGLNAERHDAAGLERNVETESRAQHRSGQEPRTMNGSSGGDDPETSKTLPSRALVVIFRTQAHIFFLSGTSHVVHLPFEVDGAFPLFHGILLQRRVSHYPTVPGTPGLPTVPPNSFAHHHLGSSLLIPSSQGQSSLADLQNDPDPKDPLMPLLSTILQQAHKSNDDAGLPRLYCLTDPLAEIGTVVTHNRGSATRTSLPRNGPAGKLLDTIDPREDLLYVSAEDELGQSEDRITRRAPLFLAVTQHQETRNLTIWSVEQVTEVSPARSKLRVPSGSSGTVSRRRSSYGPGASTGANTPTVRTVSIGRESFGPTKSRVAPNKDVLSDDSFTDGDHDLVSHLDSALENPNATLRASRRVSSLLARADLSSSHDKTTFSDLVSGYPAGNATRRGASFGSHGMRLSSGLNNGTAPRSRASFGLRSSIEPPLVVVPPHEGMLEDSDDDDDDDDDENYGEIVNPSHNLSGLRKEVIMSKIHTVLYDDSNHTSCTISKVFVLGCPTHCIRTKAQQQHCFVCLMNPDAGTLTKIEIEIRDNAPAVSSTKQGKRDQSFKNTAGNRQITVVDSKQDSFLIDACKVRNDGCSRMLILRDCADGGSGLALQAPWAPSVSLQLPKSLNVYDPYRIASDVSLKQKREGGFKRVLSQGPSRLAKFEHDGQTGKADVIDAEGTKHRIEIQLSPHNALVRKIILLCDSILPDITRSGDCILTLWWSAMSWLRSQPEDELDMEWTAFVIVLYSIAVGFIEDRRSETTSRQKRKSGLLRSSSGANTNLESWEAMLTEERSLSGVSPIWMEGEAWQWTTKQDSTSVHSREPSSTKARSSRPAITALPLQKKCPYLIHCVSLARGFRQFIHESPVAQEGLLSTAATIGNARIVLATLLIGLHLLREEMKLENLASDALHGITPVLAQLGGWLGWPTWGFKHTTAYMLESTNMASWLFDDSVIPGDETPAEPFEPPSILQFIESTTLDAVRRPFVTLLNLVGGSESSDTPLSANPASARQLIDLTPRITMITSLLDLGFKKSMLERLDDMSSWGLNLSILETLPESVAVPFRAAMSFCQAQPSPALGKHMLEMIGRDDLNSLNEERRASRSQGRPATAPVKDVMRDIHTICNSTLEVETVGAYDGAAEIDRQSVTRMVFKEDQRFTEATKLLHPLNAPVAQCVPEPEWSDTELLEAQQELAKTIAMRTLSVSPGRSCLFYSARLPLLTEKFPIHGFTLSCVMRPSNTTVTADKMAYTEEKVSWAFFHAGVEAGLSIARNAKGIDTSWILFNKPQELKNRHAGFLLALGLNGHLKSIAKWVAFKYLTPKHTMTSIGLLLGLSASYIGTMDTLITRLLSVHVTRMLPPGAAELNLSPLTQTSGIMGIGLLYCSTQHRRMSEIMLSEMENVDEEDPSNPQDGLRDEGYRLAAGFALGFINLGWGKDLKGLHDMHIVERLLALAVGTKKVSLVHILDKGTAAAAVAIALIFMKTQDAVLARKIDVPDTIHQFDYVRPDVFLLRTVARHLIMFDDIRANFGWMKDQLPSVFQYKTKLTIIRSLNSEDMPFFNIVAGLCLSIGLRFAGLGSAGVRSVLCHYLDQFIRICRLPVLNYDSKLARTTVRNCQDVVALAAACVMAGTGDLHLFRRLRALHGRTEIDIPYGSHLAAHLAIGILFLGGGTYTFGSSNIAIASLLCAFYPLFPTTVLDNKSHLQAFRHFWVLAAEPRRLVIYEVDTHRLVPLAIIVTLKNDVELPMTAPCLLPELIAIAKIHTNDPEYWRVTLDFAGNPAHLQAFKRHQSIYVRRRAAYDAHASLFSATMQALNDTQSAHRLGRQIFEWVFTLPTFANFDRAERALVLPPDSASAVYKATRGTVVDDRLVLETACLDSGKSERLWNLRLLFAWAEEVGRERGQWGWFGKEVVEALKARLVMRKRGQIS